jgi:hypothetical protein
MFPSFSILEGDQVPHLKALWQPAVKLPPRTLIEADIGQQPVGADLRQPVLGRKELLLRFEHLVIARQPRGFANGIPSFFASHHKCLWNKG